MSSFGKIDFGIKHVLCFIRVTIPIRKVCVSEGKIHKSTARSPDLDGGTMQQLLSCHLYTAAKCTCHILHTITTRLSCLVSCILYGKFNL
jgi:hypothetical protein